jgi:hypothetical protein
MSAGKPSSPTDQKLIRIFFKLFRVSFDPCEFHFCGIFNSVGGKIFQFFHDVSPQRAATKQLATANERELTRIKKLALISVD